MTRLTKMGIALGLSLLLWAPSILAEPKLETFDTIGGDFTLTDQYGKPFTLSKQKQVVLLFFGYLSCPDICPMTLMEMKSVKANLGKDASKVLFVYVTLDPERDDQKTLKAYLLNFDESFVGLRGTLKEVDQVAKLYRVAYRKREQRSGMPYTVDHSAATYMIDLKGKVRGIFEQQPAQHVVKKVQTLLAEK